MDQKREPSGPRSPQPSPKRPRPPDNPGQGSQPSPTQAPRPMNPTGNPPAPPGSGNAPSNVAPTAPPLGSFAAMVGSGGISLSALVDDINERTCLECKRTYNSVKALHGHLWIHGNKYYRNRMAREIGPGGPSGESSGAAGGPGQGNVGPSPIVETRSNLNVGPGQKGEEGATRGIDFDLNQSPPTDPDIGWDTTTDEDEEEDEDDNMEPGSP